MKEQRINNELLAINNLIVICKELHSIEKIDDTTFEKNLNDLYEKTLGLMRENAREEI